MHRGARLALHRAPRRALLPSPMSSPRTLHPPRQIPPSVETEIYLQRKDQREPTEFVTDKNHAKPVMEAKDLSLAWCDPRDHGIDLAKYSPVMAHISQMCAPSIRVLNTKGCP